MSMMILGKTTKINVICSKCGLHGKATVAQMGGMVVDFRQSVAMQCQNGVCGSYDHEWMPEAKQ